MAKHRRLSGDEGTLAIHTQEIRTLERILEEQQKILTGDRKMSTTTAPSYNSYNEGISTTNQYSGSDSNSVC